MKKNWNRIFALCLTLALVFSLAACGPKADEPLPIKCKFVAKEEG